MQTKARSLIEALANVAVGYLVAVASQVAIFPLFSIHVTTATNLKIGAYFTAISIIRSYVIRRIFNQQTK